MRGLQQNLDALGTAGLRSLRRGVEKESLRVRPDGWLADTPHPAGLGSALAHARITTDFSESQLELITGVHETVPACLNELVQIHQAVYREIGDELLWASSMPCGLPADDAIPIGRYGTSNVGRAKTVYRRGLAYRYGRRMQTISGIHYNFSLQAINHPNVSYFSLIRNFRRHSWLLMYLFGASPAVCASFVAGRPHDLQEMHPGTLYRPHATSLRMGPLGYQSEAQASLAVSYNNLASYGQSLQTALTHPYPGYETIGLREPGSSGDAPDTYRQLATSLLQIENEFYSTIRPKRSIHQGERPLHALRERGVEYVEVRLMDLNPFEPVGIDAPTMHFLDVFLLHCLLSDSAEDTPEEIAANARNQHRVAGRGRAPELLLESLSGERTLNDWALQLMQECEPIAQALDAALGGSAHRDSLQAAHQALLQPDLTPSARVLQAMQDTNNVFVRFVLPQSLAHRAYLSGLPFSAEAIARYAQMAADSVAQQHAIEAGDTMPFEIYRQHYLSRDRLGI